MSKIEMYSVVLMEVFMDTNRGVDRIWCESERGPGVKS